MQHTLGIIFKNNDAEFFDDATIDGKGFSPMSLFEAEAEAKKRLRENPGIRRINIYKILDSRTTSPDGRRHQLVHCLSSLG